MEEVHAVGQGRVALEGPEVVLLLLRHPVHVDRLPVIEAARQRRNASAVGSGQLDVYAGLPGSLGAAEDELGVVVAIEDYAMTGHEQYSTVIFVDVGPFGAGLLIGVRGLVGVRPGR